MNAASVKTDPAKAILYSAEIKNYDTVNLIALHCATATVSGANDLSVDTGQGNAIYGLILDVRESIGQLMERSERTLEQTSKTNGRVGSLEERVNRLESHRDTQKAVQRWIWAAVMASGAVVWEMAKFYIDHYVVKR